MKRCPQCNRVETDSALNFCRTDGATLVSVSAGIAGEAGTAQLGTAPDASEVHTSIQPQTSTTPEVNRPTAPTTVLPSPSAATTGALAKSNRRKVGITIGIVAVVLLMLAIGLAAYRFWPKTDKTPRSMSAQRLTTNGKSRDAAISPDAKYVVYVVDEGGQQSLWTRQVATTSNLQIIPPADVEYLGLVVSPDSNYVNFVKREKADAPDALFQMPVLGGVQKKLVSIVSSGVTYAPDGKQFAFVRHSFPTQVDSSLMLANSDGSGERVLATLKLPEFFATVGRQIPSWSPDGRSIACAASSTQGPRLRVVEVQVADGSVSTIGAEGWHYIRRIAWLPDKSAYLILGAEKPSDRFHQQVWSISYPGREVRRITTDASNYFEMSFSPDSGALVVVPFNVLSNIWIAPGGDTARASQIRSGGLNLDGVGSLAWTPDGRIVYQSLASGNQDLWIMNGDGSGQRQLTTGASTSFEVDVAPDGRHIVFTSDPANRLNIWRMEPDGSNPKQLTNGWHDDDAVVSADSRWVIFSSRRSGGDWRLWKISIDGGDAVQLTDYPSREAQVSPDGKLIACEYREDTNSSWRYAIIPFAGGTPLKVFDLPGNDQFRWSTDSRSLIYNDTNAGVGNIWSFPIDGTPPKQLTHFKTELIYNFDWSPDGKQLVLSRGTTTNDVVLIKDFR